MGSSAEELVRLHCLRSIRAGFSSRERSDVTRLLEERLCVEEYRGLRVLQTVESSAKGLGRSLLGRSEESWPELLTGWAKYVVLAYSLYVGACALRCALVVSCDWLGVSWGAAFGAAPRAFGYWPDIARER